MEATTVASLWTPFFFLEQKAFLFRADSLALTKRLNSYTIEYCFFTE
jgi:hypothetical protein